MMFVVGYGAIGYGLFNMLAALVFLITGSNGLSKVDRQGNVQTI